jgi:hypothetical protein
MKVTLRGGNKFLLQEDFYYAVLDRVEYFESKKDKKNKGQKFFFTILDKKELEEGEGDSQGKELNVLYWANGVDEDGNLTFPETGKYSVAIENLLKFKGTALEDWDGDTDSFVGSVARVSIESGKADDKGNVYSNIDGDNIKYAKDKEKAKELLKEWKKIKPTKKDEDDEKPAKKEEKKPVKKVEDEDEKPAKKPVKKDDDDDFEEEKPAKKEEKTEKKPVKKEDKDDEWLD